VLHDLQELAQEALGLGHHLLAHVARQSPDLFFDPPPLWRGERDVSVD
jgi:hypothetical protein